MASFQIIKVRTEKPLGASHEHISEVMCRYGLELNRQTVVNDIRYGTDDYYTEVDGVRAEVVVVECPHCTFSDYIKTTADYTTADNLLSLPRF